VFSKENHYLIATLSNPFFIDIKKDLESNFKDLEENLNSIKNKLFK
ncbi:TPA: poly(A) polymerase, partial [Campylobacter jejuni]|nr:poly(A) polymerase [Campylobacter jejuni]HEG4988635.1 poly(A) polymerase [Campylobacter jejuni]